MDKSENTNNKQIIPRFVKKSNIVLYIISIIIIIFTSVIKYKDYNVNYNNADATWHTLLTIESYNETPISKHLFLPIVSLGKSTDKHIPWGSTIPDKEGNFYYTSFSPAGFFLPWLFMKVFHLPVSEKSLYIFNTTLFILSALLWVKIILFIYEKRNKHTNFLAIIALLLYISAPEILHGMGIVYWHQSVFQLTFLIQLYSYLLSKKNNKTISKLIFYGTTLLNPYIEWTGYIANCGFALVEFISYWKENKKKAIKNSILIILLTIGSFILFCSHYLLIVKAKDFFIVLRNRFMARSITNTVSITALITGYLTSFKYVWVLLLLFLIWNFTKNKKLECENRIIILLCFFPIIENFIMKQHAISYSYDRMKLIFPISILICEVICNIIENTKREKATLTIILITTILCSIMNVRSYTNSTAYIWIADYRKDNEKLATYINSNYEDSVLGIENVSVRGYLNMLFKRGIYEFTNYEKCKNIAQSTNKKYIVLLYVDKIALWNTYKLGGATIYDTETNTVQKISIKNGEIENVK